MFAVKLRAAQDMMKNLPSVLQAAASRPSVIYTADGKPMFRVSAKNRVPVKITDVPKVVIDATLAAEDKRFYSHNGIDYLGLLRSLVTNVREGTTQGGSTITMQIVKRVFTSPVKSFDRKLQDMALAVTIEQKMSKNQILQLYLNEVYYGESAFGIRAAADVYFGKPLKRLTLAEAALLARCVRRPSEENPFRNPARALANRDIVLGIMLDEGMISKSQYDEAKAERMVLAARKTTDTARYLRAPYAVRHVIDTLRRDLPEIDLTQGGYRIETTLNSALQSVGEKIVEDVVRRNRANKVTTGAFILMDRDGRILVEVGGRDFSKNQFNVITQGRRQPGSAFKPFVYAAALANGSIRPYDSVSNARFFYTDPSTGQTWAPKNSNGRYGGAVSIKTAIAYSYNMPAIRVMEKAGAANVAAMGRSIFGFQSELKPFLSTALGASEVSPLEMAQGYSVFQLKGDRATPFIVRRVIDPNGNVIKEYTPNIARSVLNRDVAEVMDEFLQAVASYGTGSRAGRAVRDARGKTGTTSENKDAWFCGYTNEFVGIGWIANEVKSKGGTQYLKMGPSVYGGKVTIDIWIEVMKRAQEMVESGAFAKYDPNEDRLFAGPDSGQNQVLAPRLEPPSESAPDNTERPREEETRPQEGPVQISPPPGVGPPSGGGEAAPPPPVINTTPPKTEPPRQEPQLVGVEVCADTGRRANMYCPETVIRQYERGREPKRSCRAHHP